MKLRTFYFWESLKFTGRQTLSKYHMFNIIGTKHATQLPLKQLFKKKKRSRESKGIHCTQLRASNKMWGRECSSPVFPQESTGTRNAQNSAHFLTKWLTNKKATGGSWRKRKASISVLSISPSPFSTITPQIYYLAGLAVDCRTAQCTIYHKVISLNAVSHPL